MGQCYYVSITLRFDFKCQYYDVTASASQFGQWEQPWGMQHTLMYPKTPMRMSPGWVGWEGGAR